MKNIERIILGLIFFVSLQAEASALLCHDVYSPVKKSVGVISLEQIPDGFVQVGYESEYLFDEAAPILRDFAPDTKIVAEDKWLQMTDREHIQWLKTTFGEHPEFSVDAGLHAIVRLPFKPQAVVVDSTGNLEIVMDPENSYQDWSRVVDQIVQRYGPGSQQAMVSKPRSAAFVDLSSADQRASVRQHLGWFVYTNLRDLFSRMQSGYQRYVKAPEKLTALNFEHPFVGPMNKIKRDKLADYITGNASGLLYDANSKIFIRKNDASFKYTGGPSYRPDIAGPERFAFEERSSHKDVDDLKAKVRRDITANLSDMRAYEAFANIPGFDSVAVFAKLPNMVQTELAAIFPSKANPNFKYDQNELISLQTYRNFSLPLMDFSSLAKALSADDSKHLQKTILQAQSIYHRDLIATVIDFSNKKISQNQTRARIMGLVGKFAQDSGIAQAFDAKARAIGHEKMKIQVAAMINLNKVLSFIALEEKTSSSFVGTTNVVAFKKKSESQKIPYFLRMASGEN